MRAEIVARLAARQHGVVARRQLEATGMSASAVGRWAAEGRLHRVHRGVYAVGHPILTANGRRMAAVLAVGPGAVLSHASAAALWEIRRTSAPRIDVAVRGTGGRAKRSGLRIHRTPTLQADEITGHQGIPVTTPSRTLLDLAATLPRRALERALDEAEVLELYDLSSLDALARAHAGERGAAALQRALDLDGDPALTKSELEERMLALCEAHGLPRPRVNVDVAGLEVDFVFADQRLAVEADSWTYHRTRRAFERERERDAILARAGYRTLRFTHRQLTRRAAEVAETITQAGDSVGRE
jgi:very-short-patch-repair endonuclease/predicted transcriptional regulator of viral defense system